MKRASLIIPTHNHCSFFLRPCCESIIKYSNLDELEIIIVSNGSTDDTDEYVKSLGEPFKLITFPEAKGYTVSTNTGVKASTAPIVILMNNDVLLLPQEKNEWVNFLCNPLKDNIGITCNLKIWDESVERMFAVAFLMATPRHIWDKIGGFDETWNEGGGGGEDIEYCIKVEQLGYQIIQVPDKKNEVINGINVNRFMSFHAGEGTMCDSEHKEKWVKHIAEVRAKLKEKYQLPTGWFYGGDIAEYRRLVEDLPISSTMIELGCYKGRSLCSVADIIKRKNIKVFAVDIFTGTECEVKEPDYMEEFLDNTRRFGLDVIAYRGKTDDLVKEFLDNTFDLIFVDADHRYEAVKQDLKNWEPKLKKGGTICGHDYGNWEGVGRAVNERYSNVRVNDQHFGIDNGIATGSVWSKRL